MRCVLLALALLATAADAAAHAPTTAIGGAVTAFEAGVRVSYDSGAAVTDVEASNFSQISGPRIAIAFLPATAADEIANGTANDIAAEIAREAALEGTLVVLLGSEVGVWSEDIGEGRIADLVRGAVATHVGDPPSAVADELVRAIGAEPTGSGRPWAWIAVVLLALAGGALVLLDRAARRTP